MNYYGAKMTAEKPKINIKLSIKPRRTASYIKTAKSTCHSHNKHGLYICLLI